MSEELQGFTRWQRIGARVAVWLSFLVVGGSAATQSFWHIHDVALLAHQSLLVAFLLPLSIDGMMAIATVAMVEDKTYGRYSRPWARTGLWFGLIVSLAANVASIFVVWGWDWLALVVAGLPPILLLWSVEIVSRPGRIRKVAQIIANVSDHIGRRTPPTAANAPTGPAAYGHHPDQATPAADTPADTTTDTSTSTSPSPAPAVRRGRPEDDEPLDERLAALALQVGGAWREKTGREITRDGLRTGLREAGWQRGISNVTAGRLLDLIRADADGQAVQQDTPVGATA